MKSLQEHHKDARLSPSFFNKCLVKEIEPSFNLEKVHNSRQEVNIYAPFVKRLERIRSETHWRSGTSLFKA